MTDILSNQKLVLPLINFIEATERFCSIPEHPQMDKTAGQEQI
jgi:hypothetical protein